MSVEVLYPENTIYHGTGTLHATATSGQFMKIVTSDHYDVQTDHDAFCAGVLYKDGVALDTCAILIGGTLEFTDIGGTPVVGNEIECGADGFPTVFTDGVKKGIIIKKTDDNKYWVEMY